MAPKVTRKRKQPQSSFGGNQNSGISTVGRKQSKKQKSVVAQNNKTDVTATVDVIFPVSTDQVGPVIRKRRATAGIKNTKRKKSLRTASKNSASNGAQALDATPTAEEVNEPEEDLLTSGEMACVICQDTQESQDFVFLACGHRFHRMCNDKWLALRQYCPLCKTHIFGGSRNSVLSTRGRWEFARYRYSFSFTDF